MKTIAIVAVSENGIIGINGRLPWAPIPEDLRRFREETTGHAVIMGRGTWESLPVKPLPDRTNIVVTSKNWPTSIAYLRDNIKTAISTAGAKNHEKAYMIGGENIYREGLQYCDEVLLTRVHETVEYGPDDVVAQFDKYWFMDGWDKGPGWMEQHLGQTADGRASFYKYVRVM